MDLVSGLAFAGVLGGLYMLSKGKWLGLGDVKLAAMLGIVSGPLSFFILILASLIGSAVGIYLMIFKKAGLKAELPFGTLLAAAAIFSLIFESQIYVLISRYLF